MAQLVTLVKKKRTNTKKSRNDKKTSTHMGNIERIFFSYKMKIALVS